jgi:hypothetical protein
MKQIPTSQLVRIPNPALVQIASDVNEDIETSNDSQKTLWEEFLRLQPKPRNRQEYGKSINFFCRFGIANAARKRVWHQLLIA